METTSNASVNCLSNPHLEPEGRFAFLLRAPNASHSKAPNPIATEYSARYNRDPFAPIPEHVFPVPISSATQAASKSIQSNSSSSHNASARASTSSIAKERVSITILPQPQAQEDVSGAYLQLSAMEEQLRSMQRQYEESLLESGKQAWDIIDQLKSRVRLLEQEVRAMKRNLEDRDDRAMCLICADRMRTVVFLNCKHCCACVTCTRALQAEHASNPRRGPFSCVVCKTPVHSTIEILFP